MVPLAVTGSWGGTWPSALGPVLLVHLAQGGQTGKLRHGGCARVHVRETLQTGLLARRGPCAEPQGRPGVQGHRFRAQARCPLGPSASCTSCPGVAGPPTADHLTPPAPTHPWSRKACGLHVAGWPAVQYLPKDTLVPVWGPKEAWEPVSPSPGSAGQHRGAGPRARQGPRPGHRCRLRPHLPGHFTHPSAGGPPWGPAQGPWPTRLAPAHLSICVYEVHGERGRRPRRGRPVAGQLGDKTQHGTLRLRRGWAK